MEQSKDTDQSPNPPETTSPPTTQPETHATPAIPTPPVTKEEAPKEPAPTAQPIAEPIAPVIQIKPKIYLPKQNWPSLPELDDKRIISIEKPAIEKAQKKITLSEYIHFKNIDITDSSEYRRCINKYWALMPKSEEGYIEKSEMILLYTLLSKAVLPREDKNTFEQLADEFYLKAVGRVDKIDFHELGHFLLEFANIWCANINASEYIGLLDYLYSRVTTLKIVNSAGLTCYPSVNINIELNLAMNNELGAQVIYFKEEKTYDKPKEDSFSISTTLDSLANIVPIGYSVETLIALIKNNLHKKGPAFQYNKEFKLPSDDEAIKKIKVHANIKPEVFSPLESFVSSIDTFHIAIDNISTPTDTAIEPITLSKQFQYVFNRYLIYELFTNDETSQEEFYNTNYYYAPHKTRDIVNSLTPQFKELRKGQVGRITYQIPKEYSCVISQQTIIYNKIQSKLSLMNAWTTENPTVVSNFQKPSKKQKAKEKKNNKADKKKKEKKEEKETKEKKKEKKGKGKEKDKPKDKVKEKDEDKEKDKDKDKEKEKDKDKVKDEIKDKEKDKIECDNKDQNKKDKKKDKKEKEDKSDKKDKKEKKEKKDKKIKKNKEGKEEEVIVKYTDDLLYNLRQHFPISHDPDNSENALYELAKIQPPRILIIGKPRTGKTTISALLAKELDIVQVEIKSLISKVLTKQQFLEQNPDSEEAKDTTKQLSPVEHAIIKRLKLGGNVTPNQMLWLLNSALDSSDARLKGYILELPMYNKKRTWKSLIMRGVLHVGTNLFSHIIEFKTTNEEVLQRAYNIRIDPEDGKEFSLWEREERKKPIPKKEGDDGQEEANEENKPKIFNEMAILSSVSDTEPMIISQIQVYKDIERPEFEYFIGQLPYSNYINMDPMPFIPEQIKASILSQVNIKKRPLPAKLNPESDLKSLLMQEKEEKDEPRRWSPYMTIDPVSLSRGKLEPGTGDFAASFGDYVFLHANEANQKAFLLNPQIYINSPPRMPKEFRMCIVGPNSSGKHTIAKKLEEKYGWKIIDMTELIHTSIEAQKEEKKNNTEHPNNPFYNHIHFAQSELKDLITGKPIEMRDALALVIQKLEGKVMKRVPVKEVKEEDKKAEEVKETPPEEVPQEGKKEEEKKAEEKDEFPEPEDELYDDEELYVEPAPIPPPIVEEKKDEQPKEGEETKKQEEAKTAESPSKEKEVKKEEHKKEEAPKKEEHKKEESKKEEHKKEKKDDRKKEHSKKKGEKKDKAVEELGEGEEELPEDIPLSELTVVKDEKGQIPKVGGFIFIGFPNVKEDFDKLKEYGIEFDRVISLIDPSEEPLATFKKRINRIYTDDAFADFYAQVKPQFEEMLGAPDKLIEIPSITKKEEVWQNLINTIDPFEFRCDDPAMVKTSAEVGENDRKLILGESGVYCPVTLINESWLQVGNPEKEMIVRGRPYKLVGDKEMELMKANPAKYVINSPITPPQIHIMLMGVRGSGVTTAMKQLCNKYKVASLDIKNKFTAKVKEYKAARRLERYLLKPFKAPELNENGEYVTPEDPEIEQESEGFNKHDHEIEVMKEIMHPEMPEFYDANWLELEPDLIETTFEEMLYEARRMPELIIVLDTKKEHVEKRLLNVEEIKQQYDALMEKRRQDKEKAKQERIRARAEMIKKKKEEEGASYVEPEEEPEPEEDNSDAPNYEEMLNKAKETISSTFDSDATAIESLSENLKNKFAKVEKISTEHTPERVMQIIYHKVKMHIEERESLIERQKTLVPVEADLKYLQKHYILKESKFGPFDCTDLSNPIKSKDFPAIYRDRLYYFNNNEDRQLFLDKPQKYFYKHSIPLSIDYKQVISILGSPLSGKTSISKQIAQSLGYGYVKLSAAIKMFINSDSVFGKSISKKLKKSIELTDQECARLIALRLQMPDCINGAIIDGFPLNVFQANWLEQFGIIPSVVGVLQVPPEVSYSRYKAKAQKTQNKFGADIRVLSKRITVHQHDINDVVSFYSHDYNNTYFINGTLSKWNTEAVITTYIKKAFNARASYSASLLHKKPSLIDGLVILSDFMLPSNIYCPISKKKDGIYKRATPHKDCTLIYNNKFRQFYSPQYAQEYCLTPNIYNIDIKDAPICNDYSEVSRDISLKGYCPVALKDLGLLVKGHPIMRISYDNKHFICENENARQKFFERPSKYINVQLPIKQPPLEIENKEKLDPSLSIEESLGEILTQVLVEIASNRFIYPGLTLKESTLKMMALFLKANNPKNSKFSSEKYKQRMNDFRERCEFVLRLSKMSEKRSKNVIRQARMER